MAKITRLLVAGVLCGASLVGCGNGDTMGGEDLATTTTGPDIAFPPAGTDDLSITPVTAPGCTANTCFDFNGFPVYYIASGSGPEKIITLNGVIWDDAIHWNFVQDELAKKYSVASFEFLGMAHSGRPKGRISWATQAEVAIALADHLGWQKVHFVSFSIGGNIATVLGTTPAYQPRVQSIFTINNSGLITPATPPTNSQVARNYYFLQNMPPSNVDSAKKLFPTIFFNQGLGTEELAKENIKLHLNWKHDLLYEILITESNFVRIGLLLSPLYPRFQAAGIPFAVQISEDDNLNLANAYLEYNKAIPGATILPVLPNCGHAAIVECPIPLAKAIGDWVDGHPTMLVTDGGTNG